MNAFTSHRARQYVKHINFCITLSHGSWLNIAENELSSMPRQLISARSIGEFAVLQKAIGDWSVYVTKTQREVDWQMKIDDARSKLKSVYPRILR